MKTILWPLMSMHGRAAWDALQIKEDWVAEHYTVKHLPTNIELWVGNGFWFMQPYRPVELAIFNLFDKYACYKAAKKTMVINWKKKY